MFRQRPKGAEIKKMKRKKRSYKATVFHGGTLLGLGIYGHTRLFRTGKGAIKAGISLAESCLKICGGTPRVELVVIEPPCVSEGNK